VGPREFKESTKHWKHIKIAKTEIQIWMVQIKLFGDQTADMNWRPNVVGLGFARMITMLTKIRNKYEVW